MRGMFDLVQAEANAVNTVLQLRLGLTRDFVENLQHRVIRRQNLGSEALNSAF